MTTGISLVVQWLRICLSVQGTQVHFPVGEDSTSHGAIKPTHHDFWGLCSTTREATLEALTLQLEKACEYKIDPLSSFSQPVLYCASGDIRVTVYRLKSLRVRVRCRQPGPGPEPVRVTRSMKAEVSQSWWPTECCLQRLKGERSPEPGARRDQRVGRTRGVSGCSRE